LEAIRIPLPLRAIGSWTFMGASELRSIEFTDQPISHFGAWLFEGTQIGRLVLPCAVHTIECGAFQSVATLREVVVPERSQLTRIASRAFQSTSVRQIRLPSGFSQCELEAFLDCTELRTFEVPADSRLEFMPKGAFKGCTSLVSIVLPGVRSFSEDVFTDCPNLRAVKLALPEQTREQTDRNIRMPASLFHDYHVFVTYPRGSLKAAREQLRSEITDFA
jgi:hypothetical protein